MLFRKENEGGIYGLKIERSASTISHLMFVDDTILFGWVLKQEVENMDYCLAKYVDWTGQISKWQKSSIFFLSQYSFDFEEQY